MGAAIEGQGGPERRESWQDELLRSPRDAGAFARRMGWSEERVAQVEAAARTFRFRATRHYLSLARPEDPADPILAQVLPSARELDPDPPGYLRDAVGDLRDEHHPAPGLVRKYAGRALLVTTGLCAVNCRFCFRRAYPYAELREGGPLHPEALAVLRGDRSLSEVILSGGDPLSLTDRALGALLRELAAIPHLRRVRIHSRLPVVLPSRITPGLVELLVGTRLRPWLVTHFNHPRELHPDALAACGRAARGGVPVLNQSVLLRGVNDSVEVLADLCEGLVDAGIKPYYLHAPDRVVGTSHFEVPDPEAVALHRALRARVTGIALPALVRDLPGRSSKTPVEAL